MCPAYSLAQCMVQARAILSAPASGLDSSSAGRAIIVSVSDDHANYLGSMSVWRQHRHQAPASERASERACPPTLPPPTTCNQQPNHLNLNLNQAPSACSGGAGPHWRPALRASQPDYKLAAPLEGEHETGGELISRSLASFGRHAHLGPHAIA